MRTEKELLLALNQIAKGFSYVDSRTVRCGSEHAYRLPMGKCMHDVQTRLDSLVAAVGCPVELIDRGGVVIVRVVETDFPRFLPFSHDHLKDDRLLIGYDRLMAPVYLRLMHQLIGGASGAGKTMLIRFLLFQLVRMGAIIKIVDLKGFSFFPFEVFPNVTIAKNLPEASDLLHEAAVELEERENRIIRTRDRGLTKSFKPYVIIIDEAAQIAPKTHTGKMKEYARFCDETCARISQKGRESKVVQLYCTQKPSHDIVNGQVKANVESSIAFRTNNHYESKIILDDNGAEKISILTPGRCIYKAERFHTLQVPFIGEEDRDWDKLLLSLKVEVIEHGNSRRAEPQREYIEGSFTGANSDNKTVIIPKQFAGSEKESIKRTKGAGSRQIGAREIPPARKNMVSHSKGAAAAASYTDEVAD